MARYLFLKGKEGMEEEKERSLDFSFCLGSMVAAQAQDGCELRAGWRWRER